MISLPTYRIRDHDRLTELWALRTDYHEGRFTPDSDDPRTFVGIKPRELEFILGKNDLECYDPKCLQVCEYWPEEELEPRNVGV